MTSIFEVTKDGGKASYLLRRMFWGYIWPMRARFLLAMMFMLIVAASTAASAYLMQPVIDGIFAEQRRDLVIPFALLIIGVFFVKYFARTSMAANALSW